MLLSAVEGRAIVRLQSWLPPGLDNTSVQSPSSALVPPELGGLVRVLSLGPTESLVVSEGLTGDELQSRLMQHLAGQKIVAVDVSCALKVMRIEGPQAGDVLGKGCGLDLDGSVFRVGQSTRTRLAQISVIVDRVDATARFDLYVGRSYLDYLRRWLIDAAAEYVAAPELRALSWS